MRWSWLVLVVVLFVAAPVSAWATCVALPAQLALVYPDCQAAPAGQWPAELPLTFTYAAETTCCAGPDSCSSRYSPASPQVLSGADGQGMTLAPLLAQAPSRGDGARTIREAGIMCGEGRALYEVAGGPLVPGSYALWGANEVEIKRGLLDGATVKHYETLSAFGAAPAHKPQPRPRRDAPMGADGAVAGPRRWWVPARVD
jgi:hypothetical protein